MKKYINLMCKHNRSYILRSINTILEENVYKGLNYISHMAIK